MTEQEVMKQWNALQQELAVRVDSGYGALVEQLNNTCQQYSAFGESLMIMAKAVADVMSEQELRALVTDNVEETIKNLQRKAIVLKPFVLPTLPPPSAMQPPPIDPNSRQ